MANVMQRNDPSPQATDGEVTPKAGSKASRKASDKTHGNGSGRSGGHAGTLVREVESKFDVTDGFTLPDFEGLPGVAGVAPAQEHRLDAEYYDTADLRLLRQGITLRRRTGGSDAGWHLKLPEEACGNTSHRDEIRLPVGRAKRTVPAALAERVAEFTHGETLAPVVRLRTYRTERPVLAADGTVLAEIAQDDVSASTPSQDGAQTSVTAWSEVEVELVDGKPAVLAAIAKRIIRAGATPSPAPSKLARALADRLNQLEQHTPGTPTTPRLAKGSAGAVVLAHLAEHVQRLRTHEPLVRTDQPDAVHQMRVATRRLRSALATFRPLFDRTVTDPLREELQWLAGVLGAARDAEVIRDHLHALVEAEPGDLVAGPVQARITTTMNTRHRIAHGGVLTALDGPRYVALCKALDQLLTRPPLRPVASGKADKVLLPLVTKTWSTMRQLHLAAQREADSLGRDAALHELRKAAKRARYAGEALAPRYGKPAKAWAARMETIQETLGAHQDTVMISLQIRDLADAAHLAGENTFTYGRLHALEQARAEATAHDYRPDWKRASDQHLHRWLNN